MPTGAFKELELRSFPAQRSAHVFRTSGTSTSARGALHLDTLELYEASLLPSFARHLLPDLAPGERAPILVLAPSAGGGPGLVALAHVRRAAARAGDAGERLLPARGRAADGRAARGDRARRRRAAARWSCAAPPSRSCSCSTSSRAAAVALALPPGTRIMETGGFKGRSRELGQRSLLRRDRGAARRARRAHRQPVWDDGARQPVLRLGAAPARRAAAQARPAVDAREDRRSRDGRRPSRAGQSARSW